MKYRADVDALRALAVALVLLHHYGALSGGFVGVDVFFVLSAFLITTVLRGAHSAPLRFFYTRRVRRLFPALFATLATAQLLAFVLPDVPTRAASAAVLASLFSVSNHYFAATVHYFAPPFPHLLLHTWSLSVEEQFYLVWPFVLPALRRRPYLILLLALVFLVCTQLSLARFPRLTFYAAPFRAFEFLAGAYASFLNPPSSPPFVAEIAFVFGLVCILLPSLFYSSATPFPALAALPPVLGAVCILLSPTSALSARLQHPLVLYVGRISYSLYLVHWPLLVATRTLLAVHTLSAIQTIVLAFVTLLCASAVYHCIETPLRSPPDTTTALTLNWLLPPLLLCIVALFGMNFASCACHTQSSPSLLRAITSTVTAAAANQSASWFDARTFGSFSASPNYTLVVGDSHASVLAPFFAYLASRYLTRVQLRAVPACSPLFGVEKVRASIGVGQSRVSVAQLAQCQHVVHGWRTHVAHPSVEVVFLASRWSTAVERGEYFTRGALAEYRFRKSIGSPAGVPSLNESRVAFEQSLRHTVRYIRTLGKQVVIVGEPPDLGRGTFNCKRWLRHVRREPQRLEEWRRSGQPQPLPCVGANRQLAMGRLRYVNSVISAVANETGAHALLLSAYLCDNAWNDAQYCRVLSGESMLYRDSDHVSEEGAVYLATRWESDRKSWFPEGWAVA